MSKKKKIIIAAIVGAIIIIGIVAAVVIAQVTRSHQDDSVDVSKAVKTDTVVIKNFAFSPSIITVSTGTTVTWTNDDAIRHSVTADDGSPDMFNSGLIDSKTSYTHMFGNKGTFHYHCMPHPYMTGVVIVT